MSIFSFRGRKDSSSANSGRGIFLNPSRNLSIVSWNSILGKPTCFDPCLHSIDLVVGGTTGFAYWNDTTNTWSFSALVTGVASVNTRVGAVTLSVANSGSTLEWVNTTATNSELRIPTATTGITGLLSNTDWNTFNSKQAALSGSGIVKSTAGTISYVSGTSAQFIKGDGSLDSVTYLPLAGGTLVGNLNGVTPTEITYLSGATANIQNQINNINAGLNWKVSARVATIANITLSGTQTIDGIAVIVGDRVLVKDQLTQADNGIYVCASGVWSRSTDASTGGSGSTGVLGMTLSIQEGATQADQMWICTTDAPITIGVTALTFAKSSLTTYTSSDGITLTANNFTLNNAYFSGAFTLSGGVATIANLYVTNAMIANSTINLTTKVTGALPIANGGTNGITEKAARANLYVEGRTGRGDAIYTILPTDVYVFTNAAFTASRAWTLPAASSFNVGQYLTICDEQLTLTGTNTIVVTRAGADTIGAAGTTYVMDYAGATLTLMSDGVSKWIVVTTLSYHTATNSIQLATTSGFYRGASTGYGLQFTGTTVNLKSASTLGIYYNTNGLQFYNSSSTLIFTLRNDNSFIQYGSNAITVGNFKVYGGSFNIAGLATFTQTLWASDGTTTIKRTTDGTYGGSALTMIGTGQTLTPGIGDRITFNSVDYTIVSITSTNAIVLDRTVAAASSQTVTIKPSLFRSWDNAATPNLTSIIDYRGWQGVNKTDINAWFEIGGTIAMKNYVSSSGNITIENEAGNFGCIYVYTGSTAVTWTIGTAAISSLTTNKTFWIKNRGSNTITLQPFSGTVLYYNSAVATFTINAGESYMVSCDGTYYNIF